MNKFFATFVLCLACVASSNAFAGDVTKIENVVKVTIEYPYIQTNAANASSPSVRAFPRIRFFIENQDGTIQLTSLIVDSESNILYVKDVQPGQKIWVEIWVQDKGSPSLVKIHIRDNSDL